MLLEITRNPESSHVICSLLYETMKSLISFYNTSPLLKVACCLIYRLFFYRREPRQSLAAQKWETQAKARNTEPRAVLASWTRHYWKYDDQTVYWKLVIGKFLSPFSEAVLLFAFSYVPVVPWIWGIQLQVLVVKLSVLILNYISRQPWITSLLYIVLAAKDI